jgi:putative FmdB family regulatory protein
VPTYDYVCDACGHALEIFQPMSEAPKKKCPKCGKSKLARRIGAGAGFLFKGSGFYLTDYRSKSYTEGQKADSGASAETKSGAESSATPVDASSTKKSETKSESKSDGGSAPKTKVTPKSDAKKKPAGD